MVTGTVLAFALIAGLGAFLFAAGAGLFGGLAIPRLSFGPRVSLEREAAALRGEEETAPKSLLERAIILPAARALSARASHSEREWLERSLDLLQHPGYLKTPADYYASRVLFAMAGFVFGVIIASGMAAGGSGWAMLVFPLALSIVGYLTPRLDLNSRLQRRREQMLFEIPYTLDRLAVSTVAERSLAQGLISMVSVPEGGYLMREFRQVAEDYLKAGRLVEALERMGARNADVVLVERAAARLAMAESTGADILNAMQIIGDRARANVENMIQERGEQNNTLMIVPTLVALLGIMLAIAGPSLVTLFRMF